MKIQNFCEIYKRVGLEIKIKFPNKKLKMKENMLY